MGWGTPLLQTLRFPQSDIHQVHLEMVLGYLLACSRIFACPISG